MPANGRWDLTWHLKDEACYFNVWGYISPNMWSMYCEVNMG
jgi:hypothetical protein